MKRVTEALAAIGGAIASFFCKLPPIMWVLIAVMTLDYVTGIICGVMGKSAKTENGYISSSAAFIGLLKKALILLIVLLAALLDRAVVMSTGVTFEAVTGATCLWFIASEGFSILENAARMGIPVPKVLLKVLEVMKEKGDGPEAAEVQDPAAEGQKTKEQAEEPENETEA